VIPALLSLLDALPDDSPFRQLEPAQRRQRILTALKRVLLPRSQVQPLLLVCEDLHWIDTETQAVLDSLVESLPPPAPAARQLPPEYHNGMGQQDLLHATAAGPVATDVRRRVPARPARGRRQPGTLKTLLIERTEGQSLLFGRECTHPGGDWGAGW